MYPTEFVKTQLQLASRAPSSSTVAAVTPKIVPFKGPVDCAMYIIRERGFLGLYQGLSTLIVGTFAKASIRFYSYNQYMNLFQRPDGSKAPYASIAAGMLAGMTEAVLAVTPTETIKTKLIHDRNSPTPKYRGLIHGTRTIVKAEGFMGIYQGVVPTMLRQGANSAIRFTVYARMQNLWESASGDGKKSVSTTKSFLSGAVAGTISTVLTMPIDVVKTRLQGMDASKYKGVVDCAVQILKHEGIRTFWKGTTPRLSRVMFSSGIVFSVQDFLMRLF